MEDGHVNIPIEDEVWERRRARLRALEPVYGPQRQVNFRFRAYPLLRAIKKGRVDEFIDAFENYSNAEGVSLSNIVAIRGPSGNTLLHVAAGIENADIFRALLEVIDDEQLYTKANDRGDTALHIAARAGRFDVAKLLLGGDSAMDVKNDAGNTALHEAVKNGHSNLTDLLLRGGSTSVNKKNEEEKCPLYLAVETGNLEILLRLLEALDENEVLSSNIEGMSPVHGAVKHQRLDMLEKMSEKKKELFDLRGERGSPLHLAARENYVDGVKFLADRFPSSAFTHNKDNYLPIHVACKMGHLETFKELFQHWPDLEELLTLKECQSTLHVAAMYGRASIVKYILGNPELEKLINAKDIRGNTPLHIATVRGQLEILLSLTRDHRVNLKLVNHKNFTALDIVDRQITKIDAPLFQRLTRTILVSAGARKSKDDTSSQRKGFNKEPPNINILERRAEVRMIVAILIAGVTFTAGFSVPGGYNSSPPDAGIATLLNKPVYNVFVICNSIAMYNAIITVVILLWTQINDSDVVFRILRMTRLPLLIALATMSVAFMAGVYVTISKRTWIAIVTLIIGITALFVILIFYITLFVPLGYKCRLVQPFADCIIRVLILNSRRVTVNVNERSDDPLFRKMDPPRRLFPVRRRRLFPVRRRRLLLVRRRLLVPVVRRRGLSPMRRRSLSPMHSRSLSPVRRHHRSHSPVRCHSLSPVRRRSPSPVRRCQSSPPPPFSPSGSSIDSYTSICTF
ncbi:hypothetical protein ACJRO7_036280 [Eucalyptus globulus]|uniref:PGG domain-containing protein n=1 Tax=Eucalyptus globulus TaxID=34317 RepID=A0ABD3IKQ6_EUCGL